jgi:hypothetical protein
MRSRSKKKNQRHEMERRKTEEKAVCEKLKGE